MNLVSDSIEISNLWLGAEIGENLVNLLAAGKTIALNE
jgi:hypothetical protein